MSRCPEYFPSNNKGVVSDGQEDAEAKGSNQEGREQGVQGGDVK